MMSIVRNGDPDPDMQRTKIHPNDAGHGAASDPPLGIAGVEARALRILDNIQATKKYGVIDRELILRLIQSDFTKGIQERDVEHRVRSKLHQVGGAFFVGEFRVEKAVKELNEAAATGRADDWSRACIKAMAGHASTSERVSILPEFYSTILSQLPGPVNSVLDVACGLNPLAVPWMGLPAAVKYSCCDIYENVVRYLNEYFRIAQIDGHAQVCDLTVRVPQEPVDLALILKTIPTLEQIDKDAGRKLLEAIPASNILVSFPAKSLGGRNVGMVSNYDRHFQELIAPFGWEYSRFEFRTELAFLVNKRRE